MSIELVAKTRPGFRLGEVHTVPTGLYPDNTPVVDFTNMIFKPQAMILRPRGMAEFFTGMMLADSYAERGWKIPTLIIPCIPGARQDRIKYEGDALLTLKYVAKAINAQGFDKVITLDPHSMATTALIDRVFVPTLSMPHRLGDNRWGYVVAPDLGAEKRAQVVADQYHIPLVQAYKKRDPKTNKLSGFGVYTTEPNQLAHSHVLVVDDLCDAGGTFLGLAEELSGLRATADLFVTHGLFTKGTEALAKAYRHLYTTDSTTTRHERVTYLEVTKGLSLYA